MFLVVLAAFAGGLIGALRLRVSVTLAGCRLTLRAGRLALASCRLRPLGGVASGLAIRCASVLAICCAGLLGPGRALALLTLLLTRCRLLLPGALCVCVIGLSLVLLSLRGLLLALVARAGGLLFRLASLPGLLLFVLRAVLLLLCV